MKKFFLRLGVITTLSLALFSCDKATDEYQNLIPKDADIVLAINPAQIAEKADLSSSENAQFINNAVESMGNNGTAAQLKEIIKNPEKSGLDVEAPIYGFMNFSKENHEPEFLAFSLKLKSADDFRAVVKTLNPEAKVIEGEMAGFKTIKLEGNDETIIATKEKQGLFLAGEPSRLQANLTAILNQKGDNAFASTELFAKMNETKEDFECVINYGKLSKAIQENAPMYRNNPLYTKMLEEGKAAFPLEEVYYILALNSEKGALKFTTDMYSKNEKFDELLEESGKIFPEADETFISKLPKNSLYAMNFAVNGAKLWDFIQKYYPKSIAEAEEKAKEDLAEIGVTIEDIVKSFDGDIAFAAGGSLAKLQQKKFDIRAFAELDNTDVAVKLLNKLIAEAGNSGKISKIADNQYLLAEDMPVRFGLKDDVFFVGTKAVENTDALFEDADPNIKESSFGNKFDDQRVAMVINVSGIVEVVKPFLGFMVPSPNAIKSLEQIDYLSMTSGDKVTQSETVLKLKNDQNPYALLLELAREMK